MKKKITLTALVVLALSLVAYGTMAYLTAEFRVHNVITAGNVSIRLLDKLSQGEGEQGDMETLPDFPPQGMTIMPGTEAAKLVAVKKELRSADCWVRVHLRQTVALANGEVREVTEADAVTLELNREDWVQGQDGYYYYKEPLSGDATLTTALLTGVRFGKKRGNDHQGATYQVIVNAGAVQ